MVQKLPSLYIDNMLDKDYTENNGIFENASYSGYTVVIQKDDDNEDGTEYVTFTVSTAISGRESAYKPESKDE